MSNTTLSSRFMVRTKENVLTGPFSREEITERVKAGLLREIDEVCSGNGYWIYLHERAECLSLLGVELPRKETSHEERTETGTETATVTATKPVEGHEGGSVMGSVVVTHAPSPEPRAKGNNETIGTFKLVLWGVLILVGFILFQVFRISEGF